MSIINDLHDEFKIMEEELFRYKELVGDIERLEMGDYSYLFDKFKAGEGYKTSTGVRGIKVEKNCRHKRWKAQMKLGTKNISLGYFDNMLDALNCRLIEEVKVHGHIKSRR